MTIKSCSSSLSQVIRGEWQVKPGAQIQVFLGGVYYLQVRIFRRRTDLEIAILQTTRYKQ